MIFKAALKKPSGELNIWTTRSVYYKYDTFLISSKFLIRLFTPSIRPEYKKSSYITNNLISMVT